MTLNYFIFVAKAYAISTFQLSTVKCVRVVLEFVFQSTKGYQNKQCLFSVFFK